MWKKIDWSSKALANCKKKALNVFFFLTMFRTIVPSPRICPRRGAIPPPPPCRSSYRCLKCSSAHCSDLSTTPSLHLIYYFFFKNINIWLCYISPIAQKNLSKSSPTTKSTFPSILFSFLFLREASFRNYNVEETSILLKDKNSNRESISKFLYNHGKKKKRKESTFSFF